MVSNDVRAFVDSGFFDVLQLQLWIARLVEVCKIKERRMSSDEGKIAKVSLSEISNNNIF